MFFIVENRFGRRGNGSAKQRLEVVSGPIFWSIFHHQPLFSKPKICFPSGSFTCFFFGLPQSRCFAVLNFAGVLPRFSAFETRWAGFSLGTSDLMRQKYTKKKTSEQ